MPSIKVTTNPDPKDQDPMTETMDVDFEEMELKSLQNQETGTHNPELADGGLGLVRGTSPPSPPPLPPSPNSSSTVQTPRHEPPRTGIGTPGDDPNPNPPSTQQSSSRLALVDHSINFERERYQNKISGRIHIRNVTERPSKSLIFKIKTTAPKKFHVWPTIGLLLEGAMSSPKVTIKLGTKVRSVRQESFLVQVMVIPDEILKILKMLQEEDQRGNSEGGGQRSSLTGEPGHSTSTLESLNSMWKQSVVTGTSIEEHRVSVTVSDTTILSSSDPPPPPSTSISTKPLLSSSQTVDDWSNWSRRIGELESKLDEIDECISEQLSFVQLLLYILMGIVCCSFIILFFWGNGVASPSTALHLLDAAINSPNVIPISDSIFSFSSLASIFSSLKFFSQQQQQPPSQPIPPPPPPQQQQQQQPQPQMFSFDSSETTSQQHRGRPPVPQRPSICPVFG